MLHSDFIEYEPLKKAIDSVPDIEDKKKERYEECLACFMSVEKTDEGKEEQVSENAVKEIENVFNQVKAERIVLYPFVHLSDNPSKPSTAMKVLDLMEKVLAENHEVHRSPFGYYKAFDIKVKGHPLSELSRVVTAKESKEEISEALKSEEKVRSQWFVLDLQGNLNPLSMQGDKVTGFDFSNYSNLEKFAKYEMKKVRAVKQEPPHVKYMRELEIADYEPGSDPGNLRYYPKGRLVKSLLEQYVTNKVIDYGAMEIESPIMYDFEHPTLKKYLHRFPARQYIVQSPNKRLFLRFAACFGQFLMAHDSVITYKMLPVKIYEMTRYSFRAEQRGELTGLRRLRAFTMPDCHALCADVEQAKEEMLTRFKFQKKLQSELGFSMPDDFEFAIRITKPFWEENQEYVKSLVKEWGKPALVEMWDERFFYFVMKYEWNFVDALGKASALNTDQIDVENGERYDINYITEKGEKEHPIILHMSPSGAVERVMYALLEKAHFDQQSGKKPSLPLWLAPTQVRLIPVSDKQLEYAENLLKEFEGVRADLDDTDETLGKKIRRAEKEWIPYIVVIGEKETESGKLAVRIRGEKEQKQMSAQDLAETIRNQTKGKPFKKLSLPVKVSKRPIFVG